MPNKRKFRKNRKLKSKMKGGRYDGPEIEAAGPSDKSLEAAPVAKPIPVAKPMLCLVFRNSLPGLPSPVIKII